MNDALPAPALVSLAVVLAALRERVAVWGGRGILARAVMFLLYRRLGEIGLRMERLLTRFRNGTLRTRTRRSAVTAPRVAKLRGARIWPGRFGWLVSVCGHEAGGLSAQLRFVLGQTEMVALLQAAPQAMTTLRPLCRALAIETDLLRPGSPAAMKPARKPPAPRKPRATLDLGRIALPRGVLSAVRRRGFGRVG